MKLFDRFRQWLLSPIVADVGRMNHKLHELLFHRGSKVTFRLEPQRANPLGVNNRFKGSGFTGDEVLTCYIQSEYEYGGIRDKQDLHVKVFNEAKFAQLVEFLIGHEFRVIGENTRIAKAQVLTWTEKRADLIRQRALTQQAERLEGEVKLLEAKQKEDLDKLTNNKP